MSLVPPRGELSVVADVPAAFAALVDSEWASAFSETGGTGNAHAGGQTHDARFRVALSGGETARACYERLATGTAIDWSTVEVFLGDERCVPPDDAAANQRLVRESLLVPTGSLSEFLPMDCADPDAYAGALATRPPLDLVHLGLGPDGHTASLFPGSPALDAPQDSLVVRNEDPSGRNPYPRLTFTFSAIARGRLVVFTVSGAAKHDAFRRICEGEDLPAARVRAPRVVWLCDAAAFEG
jgi:6-phosphogluconolactonase